jgi:heptosyltransferase-2
MAETKRKIRLSSFLYYLAYIYIVGSFFRLLGLFSWIFTKPFDKGKIKKILLVKIENKIGDTILFLPVINSLRNAFPDAEISIAVKPGIKNLLETNNSIDNIIECKSSFELLKLKRSFDAAFIFYPRNALVNFIVFLMKIPYRIGYNPINSGFMLTTKIPLYYYPFYSAYGYKKQNFSETFLDLLRAVGVPSHKEAKIFLTKEDFCYAENLVNAKRPIIAICPTKTSHKNRIWPKENFAILADKLNKKYKTKVLFLGSKKDKIYVDEIIGLMDNKAVNLAGKTTIRQAAALLKNCNLLIAHDSGIMHLASIMGTPIIAIYGNGDPEVWGPLKRKNVKIVYRNLKCSPCMYPGDFYGKCPNSICMDSVAVDEIMGYVGQFLK